MANETYLQIPNDVDDPIVLRRVLTSLVQAIDEIRGDRGGDGAVRQSQLVSTASNIDDLVEDFNSLDGQYVRIDGKNGITGVMYYTSSHTFTGNQIVDAEFVEKQIKDGKLDTTDLVKVGSAPKVSPLAGDVDPAKMSAKIDEILVSLTLSKIMV